MTSNRPRRGPTRATWRRTQLLVAAFVLLGWIVFAVVLLLPHSSAPPRAGRPATNPDPGKAAKPDESSRLRLFAPTSIWNTELPRSTPIDPNSPQLIQTLDAEVTAEENAGLGPSFQTSVSSTPIYIVPRNQRDVRVALDDPNAAWRVSLSHAFSSVPVPAGARAAEGSDEEMTVYQPSTNRLWEFFHMRRVDGHWHAAWGGAMDDVSRNPGYYRSADWPGAQVNWGATATSLPTAAGVVTLAQLRSGHVDHALAIDIPDPRARVVAWPAERSDGMGGPTDLPEGAQLRIKPSVDLNRLRMPRVTRVLAEAAQHYGMIVRDKSPAVLLFGEDPTQYGGRPLYWGKNALFGGQSPRQLLSYFPWQDLEVVRMRLHRVAAPVAFLNGQSTR